jgi:hypothetical protein
VPWAPVGPCVPVHNAGVLAAEVEAHVYTPAAEGTWQVQTQEMIGCT